MDKPARSNGVQAPRNPAAHRKTRSSKLAGVESASFDRLWARLDALYDDCATEVMDVQRASALSRIAGRQITLLGMAISFQRRDEAVKRLIPAGKLPIISGKSTK